MNTQPPSQSFYTPAQNLGGLDSIQTHATLPSVLLIGDSISIGYTPVVRQRLAGRANVLRPNANCGDTRAGLEHLEAWLAPGGWNTIHFNWGLHDLCYRHPDSPLYGNRDKLRGTLSVSLDDYRTNLERLVARLEKTGARLIWASTTKVPDGEAGRFAGDELRYNAVAGDIMANHGIPTNDLYTLSASFAPELFTCPGDVHFTLEGYQILGQQVATAIDAAMAGA